MRKSSVEPYSQYVTELYRAYTCCNIYSLIVKLLQPVTTCNKTYYYSSKKKQITIVKKNRLLHSKI